VAARRTQRSAPKVSAQLRELAQQQFLELACATAPEMRAQLVQDGLPLARAALVDLFGSLPNAARVLTLDLRPPGEFASPEVLREAEKLGFKVDPTHPGVDLLGVIGAPAVGWYSDGAGAMVKLREWISSWLRRWNLAEQWIEEATIRALVVWTFWPSEIDAAAWPWVVPKPFDSAQGSRVLAISLSAHWDRAVEPKTHARRRLLAELARRGAAEVAQFLDGVEAEQRDAPAEALPATTTTDLVRLSAYQVDDRVTYTGRARTEGLAQPESSGRKTIEASVRRAALLTQVSVRKPSSGGRPRRRKSRKRNR
jgi:hypothetical protein